MMNIWDERYSSEEYIYGTEPNEYLKEELKKLNPGKILLPGEGEGRNAVFAASLGWDVTAFDSSTSGKIKAQNLAANASVNILYLTDSYQSVQLPYEHFDCLAFFYTHVKSVDRETIHKKLIKYLKPGGILLMEAFEKQQINYNSGGPKDVDMLYSKDELSSDFNSLRQLNITVTNTRLGEGAYHKGDAIVVRIWGQK